MKPLLTTLYCPCDGKGEFKGKSSGELELDIWKDIWGPSDPIKLDGDAVVTVPDFELIDKRSVKCDMCNGTGVDALGWCKKCGGNGRIG